MICYFCKKRVWFWQSEFSSYHTRCYGDYLNNLPYKADLMETTRTTVGGMKLVLWDGPRYRENLLAGLREMRDKYPELRLNIPLQ